MHWGRAIAVWLLMMGAETIHGILRRLFLVPLVGELRAQQWGVLMGSLIIGAIAWGFAPWLAARTRTHQLGIGLLWVGLTLAFELGLGRALGYPWSRLWADYNLWAGGYMGIGLLWMALIPAIAAHPHEANT